MGFDFSTQRVFDIAVASVVLAVSSPIIVAAAAAIRLTMGRPVFFRQRRTGLHGVPFSIVKFRTMRHLAENERIVNSDPQRVTRVGRIIRITSIDELPNFWNVIVGDMSVVGPRAMPVEYEGNYSEAEMRRFEVKPGITGWAQINGRNSLQWKEKLAHDIWYVEHRSLALDLKILARTPLAVLAQDGTKHTNRSEPAGFVEGTSPNNEQVDETDQETKCSLNSAVPEQTNSTVASRQ